MRSLLRALNGLALAIPLLCLIRLRPSFRVPLFVSPRALPIALLPLAAALGIVAALGSLRQREIAPALAGIGGALISRRMLKRMRQVGPAAALRIESTHPVQRDLQIGAAASGEDLRADLYPASGRGSGIGVVYAHGGSWFMGDKGGPGAAWARALAAAGHEVVDLAYSLLPQVSLMEQVGELQQAADTLREQGLERIVYMGASAGAHLALLAAYRDPKAAGVIALSAPTDLRSLAYEHLRFEETPLPSEALFGLPGPDGERQSPRQWLSLLLGGSYAEAPEAWQEVSPLHYAGPGLPPTLLIHGEVDALVPAEQSRRLAAALREAGSPVQYVEIPVAGHAFDTPLIAPAARIALRQVLDILERVGNQAPWPEIRHMELSTQADTGH